MPTPIPIIAAMREVNDATSITLASTAITPMPITIENTAMNSGSTMASSEPKASSKMMAAARRPTTSVPPGGLRCSNRLPEKATATGLAAAPTACSTAVAVPLGSLSNRWSNWIVPKAI